MTCPHLVSVDKYILDSFNDGKSLMPWVRLCHACGELLPIGPSNDSPAAVAVEIRAAVIAADIVDNWERARLKPLTDFVDGGEYSGILIHAYDSARGDLDDSECAGYLARQIAIGHDEEQVR